MSEKSVIYAIGVLVKYRSIQFQLSRTSCHRMGVAIFKQVASVSHRHATTGVWKWSNRL